jgi:hypothetical protein
MFSVASSLLGRILTKGINIPLFEHMIEVGGKIVLEWGGFGIGRGQTPLGPDLIPYSIFESDPNRRSTSSGCPWKYSLL